jgi:uncharacterized Fe-S cluster protein YjdI
MNTYYLQFARSFCPLYIVILNIIGVHKINWSFITIAKFYLFCLFFLDTPPQCTYPAYVTDTEFLDTETNGTCTDAFTCSVYGLDETLVFNSATHPPWISIQALPNGNSSKLFQICPNGSLIHHANETAQVH